MKLPERAPDVLFNNNHQTRTKISKVTQFVLHVVDIYNQYIMVRVKTRHLTVKVKTSTGVPLQAYQFVTALRKSIDETFGCFGLAQVDSSLHVSQDAVDKTLFKVRCLRETKTMVHGAITFVSQVRDARVVCSVIDMKGVVRSDRFKISRTSKKKRKRKAFESALGK